jgi:hypothetical protein
VFASEAIAMAHLSVHLARPTRALALTRLAKAREIRVEYFMLELLPRDNVSCMDGSDQSQKWKRQRQSVCVREREGGGKSSRINNTRGQRREGMQVLRGSRCELKRRHSTRVNKV